MQRVDVEADVHLGQFPNAEKAYQTITVKINEYVMRERQLVGKFFLPRRPLTALYGSESAISEYRPDAL